MHSRTSRITSTLALALGVAACTGDEPSSSPVDLLTVAESRAAETCVNVRAEASGDLGLWAEGGFGGFGLQPAPITLGGVDGLMASFVLEETVSGSQMQGAHHLVLGHVFWADDGVSWFRTEDKASCAVASNSRLDCLVNDHLRIVEGEGIYEDADGMLQNHGWIEVEDWGPPPVGGTLELSIHGRVCGSGVVD